MTATKIKSGARIFKMMDRLTKEGDKCTELKTGAHPDTKAVQWMLIGMTWIMCNKVDKAVSEFLRDLYKDTETFKPISAKEAAEALSKASKVSLLH